MEQLTITKVFISDKSKDDKEFKTKDGKKFWKVGVKFDKYGDDWYSCLAFNEDDQVMKLKEGDERLFLLEDGQYKNFKLPSKYDVFEERVEKLERRVAVLERAGITEEKPHYPTPEEEGIDVTKAGNW